MYLIKQPNGKYCSLNPRGGAYFTNFTEQDVIDLYIEKANRDMENAAHFGEIVSSITFGKLLKSENTIDDEVLKYMGFDKPYNELVKFVALRPINQSYASCDFATYGRCPTCGELVQDGIGHTDKKCRHCGQLLKW